MRLPPDPARRGRDFPTFIEIGTNRPLYVHRRGSNVVNGAYYADYSPEATLGHYSALPRDRHRRRCGASYAALRAMPRGDCARDSPLSAPGHAPLPRYLRQRRGCRLGPQRRRPAARPREIVRSAQRRRLVADAAARDQQSLSRPRPAHARRPATIRTTHVGDASDTSPYTTDHPVTGISTATYIANMARLIRALEPAAR